MRDTLVSMTIRGKRPCGIHVLTQAGSSLPFLHITSRTQSLFLTVDDDQLRRIRDVIDGYLAVKSVTPAEEG